MIYYGNATGHALCKMYNLRIFPADLWRFFSLIKIFACTFQHQHNVWQCLKNLKDYFLPKQLKCVSKPKISYHKHPPATLQCHINKTELTSQFCLFVFFRFSHVKKMHKKEQKRWNINNLTLSGVKSSHQQKNHQTASSLSVDESCWTLLSYLILIFISV